MKQTALFDRAQQEMKPGVLTAEGFLGDDGRKLADILETDEATVRQLGLTHGEIASAMRAFSKAGSKGLGMDTKVPPHFETRVDSVRGKMPCPFLHQGVFQKTNTTVRNLRSGKEVTFTDLNIHMIEAHGFYEGRGSPFHVDPAEIAAVLEVRGAPPA